MQNPVIQRIKRRAEVCQSLPVTCGRRGNDTGNGLVTVVSLRSAANRFLKNGKSPHSKPVTSPLPPSAKCRLDAFSHLARHTFATLAIEYGMPIDIIAKILGHTNTNMTRRYAKISEANISREMRRIGKVLTS